MKKIYLLAFGYPGENKEIYGFDKKKERDDCFKKIIKECPELQVFRSETNKKEKK